MATVNTGLQYGQLVNSTAAPGYVALSYIVSVVGCITALELLHRRHHYSGRYNWYVLLGIGDRSSNISQVPSYRCSNGDGRSRNLVQSSI